MIFPFVDPIIGPLNEAVKGMIDRVSDVVSDVFHIPKALGRYSRKLPNYWACRI
jgi:hypothetical protein